TSRALTRANRGGVQVDLAGLRVGDRAAVQRELPRVLQDELLDDLAGGDVEPTRAPLGLGAAARVGTGVGRTLIVEGEAAVAGDLLVQGRRAGVALQGRLVGRRGGDVRTSAAPTGDGRRVGSLAGSVARAVAGRERLGVGSTRRDGDVRLAERWIVVRQRA